ncbi:Uncharacterised protein [uncultured archaeon]|nr:Uncharacterised protein [uncultured archaeon]
MSSLKNNLTYFGKKKAASHIEIIFSFILFVGFVFFLLYFIQPFRTQTLQDSVLISLKDSVFNSVSVNLTSVLVNFSDGAPKNKPCRLNSTLVPGTENMGVINISTTRPEFSYLYYSDSPDILLQNLSACNKNRDYPLGNINNLVVLSDYELQNFTDKYTNNYSLLKEELGLLPNTDFSIRSSRYSMEKEPPEQVSVIAGVYRRLVLYGNGTLINEDFIIRVW